jgi:hypothetical protein
MPNGPSVVTCSSIAFDDQRAANSGVEMTWNTSATGRAIVAVSSTWVMAAS